ncbi:MAG: MCE family protein [Deltaproteobacteria bacterium]|nr:MCE family protein [Deltaproteobacteria bacterium]
MEERLSDQIKVGVFVLVGLLVTASIIFMLGREKKLFSSHYKLVTYFNDISGLRVGAPIHLAGITVGFVDAITFTKDPANKDVKIILRISAEYKDRIREDSEASIVTQGLLGDKAVFVSVGTPDQKVLKDGEVLKGGNVPSFTEYFDKAGELLDNINKVSVNLNKMLEGEEGEKTKKSFAGIMRSVDNILAKVDKGDGLLHALIYDPEGKAVVHNLAVLTGSWAGQSGSTNLARIFANLKDASYDLKTILDRLEKGDGTLGGLIKDPTVYYELRTLLGKANRNKIVRAVIRGTLATQDQQINE